MPTATIWTTRTMCVQFGLFNYLSADRQIQLFNYLIPRSVCLPQVGSNFVRNEGNIKLALVLPNDDIKSRKYFFLLKKITDETLASPICKQGFSASYS